MRPNFPIAEIIPPLLLDCLKDHKAYLAGGVLRDYFNDPQNAQNEDFDLVIFNCPDLEGLARSIADKAEGSFVDLSPEHGVYRVIAEGWQADLCLPRAVNIDGDLWARDFTVDAIACELSTGLILDPTRGIEDLGSGLIRAIKPRALNEDPLRMLRAYRLACQLDFAIEAGTEAVIGKLAPLIRLVAPERISAELWQLLGNKNAFPYLKQTLEVGLWEAIFPEFTEMHLVPANNYHHLPLIEHTFELVRLLEAEAREEIPAEILAEVEAGHLGEVSVLAALKMACLLHDIAKPQTWEILGEKHTFYKHEIYGAERVEMIGGRLRWSGAVKELIATLVLYHLRPFQLTNNPQQEPTEKAQRRLFRKLGITFPTLIALCWADMLAVRGPAVTAESLNDKRALLNKLYADYKLFLVEEARLEPLLHGERLRELIKEKGIAPTSQIKDALEELRDRQFTGEIKTLEEAEVFFLSQFVAKT